MNAEGNLLPPANDAPGWLRHGHGLEAEGTPGALAAAIRAYDTVIALLRSQPLEDRDDLRRELGGAWMNRGNALQKQATPTAVAGAILAYDEAIALLRDLPIAIHAPHRNCLGSAWMNRGHALLQLGGAENLEAAIASHQAAVATLRDLPLAETPAYRLNLAGAQINLAHALLLTNQHAAVIRAGALAREAFNLVGDRERTAAEFADLGLKARRAFCESIGQLLSASRTPRSTVDLLADEASNAVDSGMDLARLWENRGVPHFRALAARLFRFGAELYQHHQPQFLAEFVLENLDEAAAPPAWTIDPEFREIGARAIARARAGFPHPKVLTAGDHASERALAIHRSLADAAEKISRVSP
ncbi:MAG: hypothetical protein JWM32_602 [Verrucomicrobia bacterium]|nr:hypothetical protein [Verrucomicrobiota bacterium]